MEKKKVRLDLELVKRGLAPAREKAQSLIMAGEVLVDGQVEIKSDRKISRQCEIVIKRRYPYVSRAAFKIKKAFEAFHIEGKGLKVLDIGISTGGFSDYMLQQAVDFIVGVDVNIDQVDYNLRANERLRLLKKNARYLKQADLEFQPDLITIDVSFISITKIIPALVVFPEAKILALIKPQFESDKSDVSKGGVMTDKKVIASTIIRVKHDLEQFNFSITGFIPAGIKGKKGNQEYFFQLEYGKKNTISDKIISYEIEV
ncbi:MAG: TlyA family RNA methyltransferase [Candidatus Aminicenantes bacterium]|nr:TlyA family RNA methyltransferase [Candidatus Aminicenantes bacterium]